MTRARRDDGTRDVYDEVQRRLDLEDGLLHPYRLRPRHALIAGGALALVSFIVAAALRPDADAESAPPAATVLLLLGIAIMVSALALRRRKVTPRTPRQRADAEMRLAWQLARAHEPPAAWPCFMAWATRNPAGDVEIWLVRHAWVMPTAGALSAGPRSLAQPEAPTQPHPRSPQVGGASTRSTWRSGPAPVAAQPTAPTVSITREVLATCEPDDTPAAAEAMVEAQVRAAQAELDAHAEYLLARSADEAEQRRIRDHAARERADLAAQHHEAAIAAREAHARGQEADSLATALNRTSIRRTSP